MYLSGIVALDACAYESVWGWRKQRYKGVHGRNRVKEVDERVYIFMKLASKRREGERGRWITSCSIVLGRRGDWGWSLEIATGDQVIQSFKWLSENQSNQHRLSSCLSNTLTLPGFRIYSLSHTHYLQWSDAPCVIDLLPCTWNAMSRHRQKRWVKSDAMKGSQSEW